MSLSILSVCCTHKGSFFSCVIASPYDPAELEELLDELELDELLDIPRTYCLSSSYLASSMSILPL